MVVEGAGKRSGAVAATTPTVQTTVDEGVAVVRVDDGKANAQPHEVIRVRECIR